jgi:aspartate/methionine/tyrosine aminotransferase
VAADRTATIGELWPGLGLESWQIGYVVAPAACVEGLAALKQVLSICTSTPVQWAAVGAAEVFGERHSTLVAAMDSARRNVLEAVTGDERVLVGEAVNALALNLGDGAVTALRRLSDAGVEAADGASFGAPGVVRVAISPDERVAEAIHSVLRGVSS